MSKAKKDKLFNLHLPDNEYIGMIVNNDGTGGREV